MDRELEGLAAAVMDPADQLYPHDLDAEAAERAASPTLPALAPVAAAPLDETERDLCSVVRARAEEQVALLRQLVAQNSGSDNSDGVAALLGILAERYRKLGFSSALYPAAPAAVGGAPAGQHGVFRLPGRAGPRCLLVGHVDTVFEPGCGFEGWREQDGRLHGPGCADMKGGVVVMVSALEALHEVGLLVDAQLTVVHNGDEEVSSRGSRSLLEAEAAWAEVALVFEPGRVRPWGALTLARKGTAAFLLRVRGRAAHSGNRYIDGVSAVDDLVRKVVALARLSDVVNGCTLNVGILRTGPGAKRNRVPDIAEAEFDLRLLRPEDVEPMIGAVREIALRSLVRNPWNGERTESELLGGLAREPMPLTAERADFFCRLAGLAEQLDVPVGAVYSGGGSDANIVAACGVPVLDGLGPIGDGLHTHQEWVDLASIADRACLTAVLLHRLQRGALPVPARCGPTGR